MADADHPGVGGKEGSPRSTWWIGPIGVLMGFVVALVLVLSIDPGQAIPVFFTFSFLVIPAASGYAFRALIRRTMRSTFSSLGTAVGWMLFIGLLLGNPGGLGFMLFMLPQLFFGLGAVVIYALVAMAFVLGSQEVASRVAGRAIPSTNSPP